MYKDINNFTYSRIFKFLFASIFGLFCATTHSFIIKNIKINGLHKIKKSTVLENLPVKPGDEFNRSTSSSVIRELYKTKFFDEIKMSQSGTTLVINVIERPVIASIHFKGNKDVGAETFSGALKSAGIIKGRMFDKASLEMIEQSLKTQYAIRGKRGVVIETAVKKLPRNRVKVDINIDEGSENEIRHIRIIGNKSIAEKRLLSELDISTPGLFTYFSKSDKYSKEKVDRSLQRIVHYYQDRGYAKAKIVSHNVGKYPNINHVRIIIKVEEGKIYKLKGYRFAGNLVVPKEKLDRHILIEKGDKYSRNAINKMVAGVTEELNDNGYTFSMVDVQPEYDEKKDEVFLTFYINPGRPFYVRRVVFLGNHKTSDYVLRRELRQQEGALLSTSKVQESLRKMKNLRYIQDAQFSEQQVVGANNQVDLIITVTEGNIAEFQGNAGISTNGLEYRLGLNHHNIYGSGKSMGVNFKNDYMGSVLSYSYYNPYYTDSGIGRSFGASYVRSKPGKGNFSSTVKTAPYTMDSISSSMGYNIPITTNNSLSIGTSVKRNEILPQIEGANLSRQYQGYLDRFGKVHYQLNFDAGWSYSNYDKYPFPTSGVNLSVSGVFNVPLSKYGRYYKVSAEASFYQPLVAGMVLGISAGARYAGSYSKGEVVPFFEFYKAGGAVSVGQVRGFDAASLGPLDSINASMGGNLLVNGTIALIFPEPLSGKTFRTSIFYDVGNVYLTQNEFPRSKFPEMQGNTRSGDVRNSIGVGVVWLTPFGPIRLSFAYALNPEKGDKLSIPALSFMSGL